MSFDNNYKDDDDDDDNKKKEGNGINCSCDGSSSTLAFRQTLDEMDFERGIWYAAQQNDEDRLLKLLNKGRISPNDEDKAGYTALHYASRNGHVKICKILLDKGANVDSATRSGRATSLHRASAQGHANIVELLLKSNADTNARDSDGFTPLHRAVKSRSIEVCKLLMEKRDIEDVKKLYDNRGRNPITFAEELGYQDICQLFYS